eukprot:602293-Pelagomonas_calceolata.AAC.1
MFGDWRRPSAPFSPSQGACGRLPTTNYLSPTKAHAGLLGGLLPGFWLWKGEGERESACRSDHETLSSAIFVSWLWSPSVNALSFQGAFFLCHTVLDSRTD